MLVSAVEQSEISRLSQENGPQNGGPQNNGPLSNGGPQNNGPSRIAILRSITYDTTTKLLIWNHTTPSEKRKIRRDAEGNDTYVDTYLYNKWRNLCNEISRDLRNEYASMHPQVQNRWLATYLKRGNPSLTSLLPLEYTEHGA